MLNIFNSKSRKSIGNKRGMTLIEILIVMALVTGLMTALITQIWPKISKADRKQSEIRMRSLMQTLELYRTDCQHYPTAETGLRALITKPNDCQNWGPESYVRNEADLKDTWGNEFVYENQNSTYVLKSYGKDGVDGGTGINEDFTSENL